MSKYISATISPPRRVQILRGWKPGTFGYATAYTTHPYMPTIDKGATKAGALAFLVARSKHRGGSWWFSSEALRFTKVPTELSQLTDEDRVALDEILEGRHEADLVSEDRHQHLRATAAQLRSLRGR